MRSAASWAGKIPAPPLSAHRLRAGSGAVGGEHGHGEPRQRLADERVGEQGEQDERPHARAHGQLGLVRHEDRRVGASGAADAGAGSGALGKSNVGRLPPMVGALGSTEGGVNGGNDAAGRADSATRPRPISSDVRCRAWAAASTSSMLGVPGTGLSNGGRSSIRAASSGNVRGENSKSMRSPEEARWPAAPPASSCRSGDGDADARPEPAPR